MPEYFVFSGGLWNPRMRLSNAIGDIENVFNRTGEQFYLSILIANVRGPTGFDFLRSVNALHVATHRQKCMDLGLIGAGDIGIHQVMNNLIINAFPGHLRFSMVQ